METGGAALFLQAFFSIKELIMLKTLHFDNHPGIAVILAAATGCDLNDPDADIKRLFSQSTSYKTSYLSLTRIGGKQPCRKWKDGWGTSFPEATNRWTFPIHCIRCFEIRT
jgi:hypothetical protein